MDFPKRKGSVDGINTELVRKKKAKLVENDKDSNFMHQMESQEANLMDTDTDKKILVLLQDQYTSISSILNSSAQISQNITGFSFEACRQWSCTDESVHGSSNHFARLDEPNPVDSTSIFIGNDHKDNLDGMSSSLASKLTLTGVTRTAASGGAQQTHEVMIDNVRKFNQIEMETEPISRNSNLETLELVKATTDSNIPQHPTMSEVVDRFGSFWQEVEEEFAVQAPTIAKSRYKSWKLPRTGSALRAAFILIEDYCEILGYTGKAELLESSEEYELVRHVLSRESHNVITDKKSAYGLNFDEEGRLTLNGKYGTYLKCSEPNCWKYSASKSTPGGCVNHTGPNDYVGNVFLLEDVNNANAYYLRFVNRPNIIKDSGLQLIRTEFQKGKGNFAKYRDQHPDADFSFPLFTQCVNNNQRCVLLSTIAIGMELLTLFKHEKTPDIHMLSKVFLYDKTDYDLLRQFLRANGLTFEAGEESLRGKLTESPLLEGSDAYWNLLPFEYLAFCQPGGFYHGECKVCRRDDAKSETHARNGIDNLTKGLKCKNAHQIKSIPLWQMSSANVEALILSKKPTTSKQQITNGDQQQKLNRALSLLKDKHRNWADELPDGVKKIVEDHLVEQVKRQESITSLVKVVGKMLKLKVDGHTLINRNSQYSLGLEKMTEYELECFNTKFEFFFGLKLKLETRKRDSLDFSCFKVQQYQTSSF